MKTLIVSLADIEDVAHGSVAASTTARVHVSYTGPVVLTDGKVIPRVVKDRGVPTTGEVTFSVHASDDPLVAAEYQGFAVKVEVRVEDSRSGRVVGRWGTTVKPLEAMASPISLGTLDPAEPLPPQWASVGELVDDVNAAKAAAQAAEANVGPAAQAAAAPAVTAAQAAQADAAQSAEEVTLAMQAQFLTQDEGVEALIETNAGPKTQAALAKSTNLLPGRVAGVVDTATGITPITTLGGTVYGSSNTNGIHISTDHGATWSTYTTTPDGTALQMIAATPDGEMVVWTASTCHKSSGWASGTPTWSLKITTNGLATFNRFTVSAPDWDGTGATKMICTQYGPGSGQPFIDSRYGHISVDGGETWTLVWDSDALTGNAPSESHVHGSCYDPVTDTFFVSEGHGVGYGVYSSQDNGATWTHRPKMTPPVQPSYTNLVATDDGLVGASDSEDAGAFGIVRDGPLDQWRAVRTWRWNAGGDPAVNGHGQAAYRDPATGVVFVAYRASTPNARAPIAACTPTSAREIYTWQGAYNAGDDWRGVTVSGGHLLAGGVFATVRSSLRARLSHLGAVTTDDPGNVGQGVARWNTSIAVGPRSSTGQNSNSIAIGVGATVNGAQSIAIGTGAKSDGPGSYNTLLGDSVVSTGGAEQTAIGAGANVGSNQFTTAIGRNAAATGSRATIVGRGATGSTYGVAIGYNAAASVSGGVAVGDSAVASHANSVAVGRNAATTAANQVQVADRHLELAVRAFSGNPAVGTARLAVVDPGTGLLQLQVRFSNGQTVTLGAMT